MVESELLSGHDALIRHNYTLAATSQTLTANSTTVSSKTIADVSSAGVLGIPEEGPPSNLSPQATSLGPSAGANNQHSPLAGNHSALSAADRSLLLRTKWLIGQVPKEHFRGPSTAKFTSADGGDGDEDVGRGEGSRGGDEEEDMADHIERNPSASGGDGSHVQDHMSYEELAALVLGLFAFLENGKCNLIIGTHHQATHLRKQLSQVTREPCPLQTCR